ncbi:MAG: chemotaxis protein CheW [Thiogranum sp.]|nr:chemotaxis protein CheW [Thiogranum sp.]
MNAVVNAVRALWVPLHEINVLLPNVAIAEVINYQPLELLQDGPDWLLGKLRWRNHELPTVSMERICGYDLPQSECGARISIVNSVKPRPVLPFFAMVTAGIPRLFNADADALGDSTLASGSLPHTVDDCVRIGSEDALIPNLVAIQSMLEEAWSKL